MKHSKPMRLMASSVGILLIALLLFCNEAGQGESPQNSSDNKKPTTAPADESNGNAAADNGDWYVLNFTNPVFPDKAASRPKKVPIMDALVKVINSAKKTLDIAIYELNLPEVGEAILAAKERGVQVRMVTDSDEIEELEVTIELHKKKIPMVEDNRGAIMHNKFVVVDGKAVWTGSWNFQPNDTYRNNNHGIFIKSKLLAENYTAEFEEMFTDQKFGPTSPANTPNPQITVEGTSTKIEVCFAPEDDCADQLINAIEQTKKSIIFMAFSFTHEGIGEAVIQQGKNGVKVQGIFETRGSETKYSELGAMKKAKFDVVQDGNPYTLHHKVFILDNETVVLGSFNFSKNADEANDEIMLIIHNSQIAKQFQQEWDKLYEVAENPPNK